MKDIKSYINESNRSKDIVLKFVSNEDFDKFYNYIKDIAENWNQKNPEPLEHKLYISIEDLKNKVIVFQANDFDDDSFNAELIKGLKKLREDKDFKYELKYMYYEQ